MDATPQVLGPHPGCLPLTTGLLYAHRVAVIPSHPSSQEPNHCIAQLPGTVTLG